LHTFSYDGNNRLTGESWVNTNPTYTLLQNEWNYASSGALASYTWGSTSSGGVTNPSTSTLTPALVQGLAALAAGAATATSTDPTGHTTSWQLDGAGRPLQLLAADGGLTQYTRDVNGRVTVMTDPLNRRTTYTLDSAGYVTQIKNPDGTLGTYQYSATDHALTAQTDERGNTTSYLYDAQGHRTVAIDALTNRTTYTYFSSGAQAGLLSTATDPLNHTTSYQYDNQRRQTTSTDALGNTTTTAYDSNGYQLATTDPRGNTTTYANDVMGRQTQETDAYGSLFTYTYDAAGESLTSIDALGHQTSTLYDLFHRGLVAQTLEGVGSPVQISRLDQYDNAGRTSAIRNANGWTSSETFDPVGRITQSTDALGNKARTFYDLAGQPVATRDVMGRLTQSIYDQRGRVTKSLDALGNVTTSAYDLYGNLTAVTDPLNHTTTYQYDALNRQIVVTDALSHSVTTTFDAAGNVSTVTDVLNHTTSYSYDALNRATTITKAVGTAVQQTTQTGYDKVGNVTSQTDALNHTMTFAYDNLNRQTAMTDALGHTVTTAYNKVGDATTVTDPLNKVTSYAYDARDRLVTMTDPLGNKTTSILDSDGNAIANIDPLGDLSIALYDMRELPVGNVDMNGALTQSQKDAAGNTADVIDPDGNQTAYVYDALNRSTVVTDALNHSVTTTYDAAGRVTSVIDRDNRQTTFAYDAADRLTSETWLSSPGGSVVNRQTFTYDNKNQLLTAADYQGTITLGYDALDRPMNETDVLGLTVTVNYDFADRPTLVQDSKGGLTTSVFDNANRLISRKVSVSAGTARIDYGYSNRNELTSLTRYSDVGGSTVVGSTVYAYDDASRTTAITHKNSNSATLSYYNYSFDNANRVTQEVWGSGSSSGTHTYAYDSTNQLTMADGTAYGYDANGNRNTAGYQTGTANQLTNDGVYTYVYDAESNLTGKSKIGGDEVWTYGYDQRNLLTSVTESGSATFRATYIYDVAGRRVVEDRTDNNGVHTTTHFAFAGKQVWAELDSTNTTVQGRYVYGDGETQVLARIDATAGVQWLLEDRLGSIRDVADATQVKDHLEFQPFGGIASESNSANGINRSYTGMYLDRATGIAIADERTLLVTTGQWMQEDPLMFGAGDANLRRYVSNDPTNVVDPSGLEADDPNGDAKGRGAQAPRLYIPPRASVREGMAIFGTWCIDVYNRSPDGLRKFGPENKADAASGKPRGSGMVAEAKPSKLGPYLMGRASSLSEAELGRRDDILRRQYPGFFEGGRMKRGELYYSPIGKTIWPEDATYAIQSPGNNEKRYGEGDQNCLSYCIDEDFSGNERADRHLLPAFYNNRDGMKKLNDLLEKNGYKKMGLDDESYRTVDPNRYINATFSKESYKPKIAVYGTIRSDGSIDRVEHFAWLGPDGLWRNKMGPFALICVKDVKAMECSFEPGTPELKLVAVYERKK
jgi:RHS repeat-associated protein